MANTTKFNKGRFLNELRQFTGSEMQYNYMLGYRLTEGAKYVADECGAYWLMDVIVSYYFDARINSFWGIQRWVFEVNLYQNEGVVKCYTTNDEVPSIVQKIPFTDFPVEKIELYCQSKVIFLPREN
jgi:hypothetical protein